MKRAGFAMQLKPGMREEYKRRHDEIWPDLSKALTDAGVHDYVIFLDPRTDTLYASQKLADGNTADELPSLAIVQEWWAMMADIMETNPDNSPRVWPLDEMFYHA